MMFWELQWFLDHVRPEAPVDATLEPPLQADESNDWPRRSDGVPTRDPLIFGITFLELNELDYPSNDQDWPLMRESMVDALEISGHPSITTFPVVMIEAEIKEGDDPRLLGSDADENVAYALAQPHMVRKDFSVLRIAPLEGVLDLNASIYRTFVDGTGVRSVEQYVLKEPEGGLPPLFRLAEQPRKLFITQEARERLKKAGIRGPIYRIPGGPPAKDEVDVPVLL